MDGLARVAGMLDRKINIGGRIFTLATPTLRAWAKLESQLVAETNDILSKAAEASAKVPPDQRAVFWEQAHKTASQRCAVRVDDIDGFPPFEQIVLQWFLCLQRHHADEFQTLQSVRDFLVGSLGDVPFDELSAYVAHIVEGGLKNSTGPTETETAPTQAE